MANWWHKEPIRLVQTNLREIDARRDPREIVREVKAFGANAILFFLWAWRWPKEQRLANC